MSTRDQRFKATHRGGSLTLDHHRFLANWAADCAGHVLSLFHERQPEDTRPAAAIDLTRSWALGEITVDAARDASLDAHSAARDVHDMAATHAARAAGHAVATAHMADHALDAAMYAIKAVVAAAKDPDARAAADEHDWQQSRLPDNIRDLVLSAFDKKYPAFARDG